MLRKLLICPWFGPLPSWWAEHPPQLQKLADQGYDMLIVTDLRDFFWRVSVMLDVTCPITPGSSKIHDYRATFGTLFAEDLRGYDFWGHTDFDCVYGRPGYFIPDDALAELDVHSDHWNYICGPWTLYRNLPTVNERFRDQHNWAEILAEPATSGWVEKEFTAVIDRSGLRVRYQLFHGWGSERALRWDGPALLRSGREISFFHFNRTKLWPVIA